jgi:eukaryotic-like serine/threonine-protein kinase
MNTPLGRLLIGRSLAGRYRVEEPIGEGGMGLVFRATDLRLGRPVALKVVAQGGTAEDESRSPPDLHARFRREAAAAAGIPPHPNVVQIHDFGTDDELGLEFLVMELLRGRDLKSALRNERFEPPAALRIVLEAARGLAAGHRAGVVHRDVKPANLFLVGDHDLESVRVLDFGIAKALGGDPDDDLTGAGHGPHSPAYASPEQRRGEAAAPASDVYQLGLVAYELLAGARPYDAADRDRLRAGEAVPVPASDRWSRVPAPIRDVVERALDPDPSRRWEDGGRFAESLAGALGSPVDATERLSGVAAVGPRAPEPVPGGDETLLDEGTAYVEPAPPASPVAQRGEAGAEHPGVGPRRDGRRGGRGRLILLGLAAAAGLSLVLLLRGGGGEDPASTAPGEEAAELEEEFRPLYVAAARHLLEERSDEEGERAAGAVLLVVQDLHDAWAHGEIDRHAAHYADRVDFYGERVRRSRVRELREETRERYDDVEITLLRQAVEFPEPGRARVLLDKRWSFRGEERWEGSSRQEMELVLRDDRWVVVAERDLEVHRSERTFGD